jgi:peptidoglycan/LPS O-acetylase OafA/YrhL
MWFYFGLGVVVFHRLCRFESRAVRRLVDTAFTAGLGASALLWLLARSERSVCEQPLRHIVVVQSFALFLIAFRRFDSRLATRVWFRPFMALGVITYSLYLLHQFNVVAVAEVVRWAVPDEWVAASIAAQVGVHVAIATCFWRYFERPYLNRSTRAPGTGDRGSVRSIRQP